MIGIDGSKVVEMCIPTYLSIVRKLQLFQDLIMKYET